MVWGAIIGAAATIGAGLIAKSGAEDQNVASAQAAQKQMEFQERMSNTQYQRSMADMRKAGLNPILAYRQGGAGTPGGSTYSPVNVGAATTTGASAGASSALAYRRLKLEEDTVKAATTKMYSESTRNAMEYEYMLQSTKNAAVTEKILRQQKMMNMPGVTSAKQADQMYKSSPFLKWYNMIMGRK